MTSAGHPPDSLPGRLAVLGLRLAYGALVLCFHGIHKAADAASFVRGNDRWPLAEEIAEMGVPLPNAQAFLATTVQVVCPLLLIAGVGSRTAAALLAGVLAGAVVQNMQAGRDPQLAVLYCLVACFFAAHGPGCWTANSIVGRRTHG